MENSTHKRVFCCDSRGRASIFFQSVTKNWSLGVVTKAVFIASVLISVQAHAQSSEDNFTAFESGHVRPIAVDTGEGLLVAVNTPDNRLTIYRSTAEGLMLAGEVPVGLEPVSVALRTVEDQLEAWVVNHLSDSISVVSINNDSPSLSSVTRTLYVGDEPRDIVFAGPDQSRVFITTAHRGQHRPEDPQLTSEGVPRADVWVFDVNDLGTDVGGNPLAIVELFGDTPRALAVSPDGKKVYAAVFASGNGTTTIPAPVVSGNGGLPAPPDGATEDAPVTGLIVKYSEGQWLDETGKDWSSSVPFTLPDYDVFEIDATKDIPAEVSRVSGVGTALFNMAVRPDTGALYVSNTEAFNEQRFEPVLNGRFIENRISIVKDGAVNTIDLNPHINYSEPVGENEVQQSLASPGDLLFSSNGQTLYVTAFSSGKVAVFDSATLEEGNGGQRTLIEVGEGPSGVALDEQRSRLYVMNRLDHSISIVDTEQNKEVSEVILPYNPEPESVVAGRKFLYDARLTSGRGNVSCHSCHLFGDMDQLAWDLGDPFGEITENPSEKANVNGSQAGGALGGLLGGAINSTFHPMKGPMTTQSLRGMADAGPMHWRGDKTGGLTPEGELDPSGDYLDERAAFSRFNSAFVGLQGRDEQLSESEMSAYTDFALQLRYPPNPVKSLNNKDSELEAEGRDIFINDSSAFAGSFACNECHALPVTTTGLAASAGFETGRLFKIPHLRNLYQKVGKFGAPRGMTLSRTGQITLLTPNYLGEQVRGFGFSHDGSISTIDDFLHNFTFTPVPTAGNLIPDLTAPAISPDRRSALEAFMLSMDTGLSPIVGQQLTLTTASPSPSELETLELLLSQAGAGNSDIVVKGVWGAEPRGALYLGGNSFKLDREADSDLTKEALLALINSGNSLTFTAVPVGEGQRIGIDRDLDGVLDADEQSGDPVDGVTSSGKGGGALPIWISVLLGAVTVLLSQRRKRFSVS